MGNINLPIIYWILQDNQVTPSIINFLGMIKNRVKDFLTLKFYVPEIDKKILELTSSLEPIPFQVSFNKQENTYEGYCQKRDELGSSDFSDGLQFWRTLLLDDLGSGTIFQVNVHAPNEKNVAGIILQIPTPLGSSQNEERIFYSWVHLAKMNRVPVIGYELLPLSTRWTLVPSLMDGIITTRKESLNYLTGQKADLKVPVWNLPRCESTFFSPATHNLWQDGIGARYHYQSKLDISPDRAILYLPQNVAMTYEYGDLIERLLPFAPKLHLMFSIGKDQIRGSHNHKQIIETVYNKTLPHFSYSFHDLNRASEVTMANAVVSCADCFGTEISSTAGIPTIIYDPMTSSYQEGFKILTNNGEELLSHIDKIIRAHQKETELSYILINIAKRKISTTSRGRHE